MDIIFFIAGLVLLFKKKVKVSSKAEISGRPVKVLGIIYVLPFLFNFILGTLIGVGIAGYSAIQVSFALIAIAIVATIYCIHKYKTLVDQTLHG